MNDNLIIKNVLEISRKVETFLNDNMLPKFVSLHGIDPKYSVFNLKQELVAKTALFFDVKKKYSLYIVNKNGREKEELFHRGIAIRRSEYPSYTKECLKHLLNMILKSEKLNLTKIREYIIEIENKMTMLILDGSKEIAKPVSCKNINSYKKIPSHMLGMLLWNDLEYDYFVDGTKGYQYKITGIDVWSSPDKIQRKSKLITNKNNNIVVPFEETSLPNYYMVDVDAMLQFAWTNRYKEILGPIVDIIKFKK